MSDSYGSAMVRALAAIEHRVLDDIWIGRRRTAIHIAEKLGQARGATAFILPLSGIQEWDRPGQPLHDAEGHAALVEELRRSLSAPVELVELDAHINDDAFADTVMAVFDGWVAQGIVAAARRPA